MICKVFDTMKFFGYMKNRLAVAISYGDEVVTNIAERPHENHPFERAADEPVLFLNEELNKLQLYCPETKTKISLATNRVTLQDIASLQTRLR